MEYYPTNADDVIDSRDIIEAIEELGELSQDDVMPSTRHAYVMLEALLAELRKLAEDYDTDTPEDGMTLVRDSYFKDHAREMVEECGYFTTNADRDRFGSATTVDFNAWPYRCIDWQQVADELRQDYTAVLFDGVAYWVR